MKNSKFNFQGVTVPEKNNRLYILWDERFDNEGLQMFPTDEEVTHFMESLNNEDFYLFDKMEMDKGVASYFGYDNCQIFGIDYIY